ncbi:MAG: hypothetical protein ACPL7I_10365, partial [Myxococcota bacterium]
MKILRSFILIVILTHFPLTIFSQDMQITSKHSDFSISEQGKVQKYIHLKSDGDLVIKAKGPMFINIKFRALVPLDKKGQVSFNFTYLRDGGFRSINEYTLKLEPKKQNRKIEIITEGTYWASEHRWIQIKVPEGEHIYQISRPQELSEGLILKIYKSEKEEPQLLAKPEVSDIPIEPIPLKAPKSSSEKVIIAERVTDKKPLVEERRVVKEEEKGAKRYFSVALKANVLVPTSRVDSTYAFSLDLKYISPLLHNRLAFGVEAGYYPLSGSGKNLDAEIGLFDYSFSITNIPIFIGAEYLLPIKNIPVGIFVNGGGSIVLSYSTSKVFEGESYSDGIAYGYFLGAGAQISPGYGFIVSEIRYSSAY